jgi:serine O-acetyltransferase
MIEDAAVRGKRCIKYAKNEIKADIKAFRDRDPAARSDLEVALLYSGFHAIIAHRAAHALHKKGYTLTARAISQGAKLITGIEIHPGATIGKNFVIDHGAGVVIGETAEIGDNCTLYQGVTLGGTGKDTGKRHPTLGNNVMVGCGAKVLGPFKIGDNSKIAANAVVLKEIPSDSTAVGIPAKVVRTGGKKIIDELDQVTMPDPVSIELNALKARIAQLEQILDISIDTERPVENAAPSDEPENDNTISVEGLEVDLDDPVIREIFGND